MAKLSKATKRDKKINRRKYGMRVSGKGFVHIQNAIAKRAQKAKGES